MSGENSAGLGSGFRAIAPGKVILFGEHAINRGQPALAASVGLYAECTVRLHSGYYLLVSSNHQLTIKREEIISFSQYVEELRSQEKYDTIRQLKRENYFAPTLYILGTAFKGQLPAGLRIEWKSAIPPSSGLGSGGAAFTALAAAIAPLLNATEDLLIRAHWAHLGDIIAHGGIASALDTQTSLLGGIIRYTGRGLAESLSFNKEDFQLLIAHTGVQASTAEVNEALRLREAAHSERYKTYFETIGTLANTAMPLLASGRWQEFGQLLSLNQFVLEKIGVSCQEIEKLVLTALDAGAYGAKLAGSGGGGIVIVLVSQKLKNSIVQALRQVGAKIYHPPVGVPGVRIQPLNKA